MTDEAEPVTFVWPDAGGARTGSVHMEWRPGWTVQRYLHEQPLRAQYLAGIWKRCRAVNRSKKKVKLNYIPTPGDAIVLSRVRPIS